MRAQREYRVAVFSLYHVSSCLHVESLLVVFTLVFSISFMRPSLIV